MAPSDQMSFEDVLVEAAGALCDDLARSTIRAEHSSTLFVEAGAGTGKTSELVGRIVELVRSGSVEMRELAAITFTEAAATELRERVRQALSSALPADTDGRVERALLQLNDAAMTTIHGFCHRILAEHPLEAGLPLRFVVMEEVAASLRFERRFARFLDELYDEEDLRPVLAAAHLLGIGARQLRLLARRIDERYERASGTRVAKSALGELETLIASRAAKLRAAGAELRELARGCSDPGDHLLSRLEYLAEELSRLDSCSDWRDELSVLVGLRLGRIGNVGKKASWTGVDVEVARDALRELGARRDEAVALVCDVVVRALGERLAKEALFAATARRRDGELRFDDLLTCCRDLLAGDERVRESVRNRYRKILVDEFQDTDPLQLEIVTILGRDASGDIEAGRLFFVGDPKQSIYRFRGADLGLYERARRELAEDASLRLQSNFRSVPGVLAVSNAVFEPLMGPDRYVPLVAVRPALPALHRPAVTVLGGPVGDDVRAAARRALEAGEVVAAVEQAIVEHWPVEDGGEIRPARLSDVAILVPRRSGLYELEQALEERQLAYRVESSTLIYASREVRDLLAILRAVARPFEERAIVAALRTPAIGASDEDLFSYRRAGGEWRLGASAPGGGPVGEGLEVLFELAEMRAFCGPVEILAAIVDRLRIGPLFSASRRPAEALRRLRFLESRVRAFAAAGGTDLEELVVFMELEQEQGVRGLEPAIEDGEDALRILTVHGAKGLEFPIVVLAELGGEPTEPYRGPGVLFGESGAEYGLSRDRATAGYLALREEEDELARAEMLRIGYVAFTRARDHLVISLFHKPAQSDASRSLAERVFECLKGRDDLVMHRPSGARVAERAHREERGSPVGLDTPESFERALARDKEGHGARSFVSTVASSSLEGPGLGTVLLSPGTEDPSGYGRRRAASGFGRAVHRVLQLVSLERLDDIDALSALAASEENCGARAAEVAARVRLALGTEVVQKALLATRWFREMPFTVSIGEGYLEGVVDLCYLEGDEFVVVDYKTDALGDTSDIETIAARYRLQAGAYALGLEAVTSRRVARVVLVLLGLAGQVFELEVNDLELARAEARQAIKERLSRGQTVGQ